MFLINKAIIALILLFHFHPVLCCDSYLSIICVVTMLIL